MADALGVPVVRESVYSYEESPPLDDVMSYITVIGHKLNDPL